MSILAANPCTNRAPTIWTLTSLGDFTRIKQPNDGDIAMLVAPEGTEFWVFDADGDPDDFDNISGGCQGAWVRGGPTIPVVSFGAIGDWNPVTEEGTDVSDQIDEAIDAAANLTTSNLLTRNPILFFPYATGYRVTRPIIVPESINVIMDGPIVADGTDDYIGLTIGRVSQANLKTRHRVQVVRANQSDWGSEDNIGVKIINANSCGIDLQMLRGHTIGAQYIGAGALCGYNRSDVGLINNNQIGLDLTSVTAAAVVGATNQNQFYGGRIDLNSAIGSGLSRYGIRLTTQDSAPPNINAIPNGNSFFAPSMELQLTDAAPGVAIPVLSVYGNINHIYDLRTEGNSSVAMRNENSSQDNIAEILFGSGTVQDAGDHLNLVYQQENHIFDQLATLIWHSGEVYKTACYYDGAGLAIHVPKCHIATSGGANVLVALTGLTLNAAYLEIGTTRGLGVMVDTSVAKRFMVRRDMVSSANGGFLAIRCYDAAGTVITTAGLVDSQSYGALARDLTIYGGVFIAGSASDGQYVFQVDDAVKSIAVIIAAPSGVAQIRSFSIYSINDRTATCYPGGYEQIFPGANLMTTPPTAGTWVRGRQGWNVNPASGQPLGWSCISGGAPGTWAPWANIP